MKVRIAYTSSVEPGVPLCDIEFGTVVRRFVNGLVYLVASPMDGSGRRVLISLPTGTLKEIDQATRVIPVDASLVVSGMS